MPESKISKAPQNNSFAASFIHFKLRREHKEEYKEDYKEDYMEVGESKTGIGLQDS